MSGAFITPGYYLYLRRPMSEGPDEIRLVDLECDSAVQAVARARDYMMGTGTYSEMPKYWKPQDFQDHHYGSKYRWTEIKIIDIGSTAKYDWDATVDSYHELAKKREDTSERAKDEVEFERLRVKLGK